MNVYIIEAFGKDSVSWDTIVQRHPNAFTTRELAEAEKDAFLESVRGCFDSDYAIDVQVIELEVVGEQSVWIAQVEIKGVITFPVGHCHTQDAAIAAVEERVKQDTRLWVREGNWWYHYDGDDVLGTIHIYGASI